ncbi:transporter substrate-binding domain-containing protein [Rhodocytophaga rosea]|uniref:Transporter substrate-binding domain-containing protein n=1 Tax=Rhodocytophaga rosea TaxID=2704465 RepID=A0A6C0GKB0_9BACT|nr:transporter substrate-binding domain-containing protein [Rhodocytophaga rosea]QHT68092.1 transporter substrate-binding domain-containing protein [Rhodocytophaga rosea]
MFKFKPAKYSFHFIVLCVLQVFSLGFSPQAMHSVRKSRKSKTSPIVRLHMPVTKVKKRSPLKDKKIKVLLDASLYSHSIYKGVLMGLDYELINLFAQENGLEVEAKIMKEAANMIDSLQDGEGDIIAFGYNVTPDRLEKVDFSIPVIDGKHCLVQRRNKATSIDSPAHLNGKIVMIRKNSCFKSTLESYAQSHNITLQIQEATETVTDEDLIQMVAKGKIDYTVTYDYIARNVGVFHDNINYSVALTKKLPVSWVVNKGSEDLLETLNQWIKKRRHSLEYNLIVQKYNDVSETRKATLRQNLPLAKAGSVSEYDGIIKKYAQQIQWDWKLIAALVFQESRFNPTAKSWVGATGLMQLMPVTAKELGLQVNQLTSPERNLQAGIKYLQWLEKSLQPHIHDKKELVKFVLASYNVGLGHVLDARRLAEKYHLNAQKWEGNVEQMLLKISKPEYYKDKVVKCGYCRGKEPVSYVKNILGYYNSYQNVAHQHD